MGRRKEAYTRSRLHRAPSFEMTQVNACNAGANRDNIVTSRSAFILRFISTIALWTVEFPKLYLDTSFAFLAKRFA